MQTLIIARDGLLYPVFSSIEEWLGAYTEDYYGVLTEVAQDRWSPERSTRPWVRFCLKAHYQQASTLLRRLDEYEQLYRVVEREARGLALNARTFLPLFDAALGTSLTNARYQASAEVNRATAMRDLRQLVDLGLLDAQGETGGRRYLPGAALRKARLSVRIRRPLRDPYEVVRETGDPAQPRLPL